MLVYSSGVTLHWFNVSGQVSVSCRYPTFNGTPEDGVIRRYVYILSSSVVYVSDKFPSKSPILIMIYFNSWFRGQLKFPLKN